MAAYLLEDWCKGMNIDPNNCILVIGIPEGFDEGSIEPTLEASLASLSNCRMRGRMFWREEGAYAALCELKEPVEALSIPKELAVAGSTWKIVTAGSQSQKASASDIGFLKKMTTFLEKEGKTMADMPGLLGLNPLVPDQETASSAKVWEKVLEQVLDKVMQPHPEFSSYRKLRLFSGDAIPIPGEEGFEPWLEHTTEMLQEWAVPDAEKRRRLIESLRGPALDVIRTLKLVDPGVCVKDCLEALAHAFGRNEGSEDVYCKFLSTRQQKGEKLSDYVQRLEKLLQRAVLRGAVTVRQMDQTRLAQIVRGAQYQNAILLHLRLRERQGNPPSYSQLIKEVREEEERQAASESWESQPAKLTGTTITRPPKALMVNSDKELAQQVQVLTEQVAELRSTSRAGGASRHMDAPAAMVQKTTYKTTGAAGRQGKGQPSFCYRCGQEGHILARCQNEGNPTLVYQKLQTTWEKPGNGRRAWEGSRLRPQDMKAPLEKTVRPGSHQD